MPDLLLWRDEKAWCLFTREWTEAFEVSSGSPELNVLSNYILDREPRSNVFFCLALHVCIIALFTSVIVCA